MSESTVSASDDRSRRVRTRLVAVDPRSALYLGAAVGACLFVAWMIAAVLVYILLGATGVWDRVNSLSGDLLGSDGVSVGMYFGLAALVGLVEVVVAALFVPLSALLYNAVAGYVGGLWLTLGEGVTVDEDVVEEDAGAVELSQEPVGSDTQEDAGTSGDSPGGPGSEGWGKHPAPITD